MTSKRQRGRKKGRAKQARLNQTQTPAKTQEPEEQTQSPAPEQDQSEESSRKNYWQDTPLGQLHRDVEAITGQQTSVAPRSQFLSSRRNLNKKIGRSVH